MRRRNQDEEQEEEKSDALSLKNKCASSVNKPATIFKRGETKRKRQTHKLKKENKPELNKN